MCSKSFSLQNLPRDKVAYCVARMTPYVEAKTGREIKDAYDYSGFVGKLFV